MEWANPTFPYAYFYIGLICRFGTQETRATFLMKERANCCSYALFLCINVIIRGLELLNTAHI